MSKQGIKDPEYIAYIEQLPCYACGHKPEGVRKIYNEYTDSFDERPCKNTAHHVDTKMTRHKNDHRVLPCCSHYVVSGKGTHNCHEKEHSEGFRKKASYREHQIVLADRYYYEYCILKGIPFTVEDYK